MPYATLQALGPEHGLGPLETYYPVYGDFVQESAVLTNGDLAVVRYDYTFNSAGPDKSLIAQVFNPDGEPVTSSWRVWGDEYAYDPRPFDVEALTDGRFIVGFNVGDRDAFVRVVTYNPDGSVFYSRDLAGVHGNDAMPLDFSPYPDEPGFVGAWAPDPYGAEPGRTYTGAFNAGFGASGTGVVFQSARPLFTTTVGTAGDYLVSTPGALRYADFESRTYFSYTLPSETMIQAGATLVGRGDTAALVWIEHAGDSWKLLTQLFDASKGGFLGAPTVLDQRGNLLETPRIVPTPDGGYVVSWHAWGDQGYALAKTVGADGSVSPEFVLNGDVIGLRGDDQIVTVREDNANNQLFMQTYALDAPIDPGRLIVSDQYGDQLIGGSGGDTLVAGQGPDTLTGGGGDDLFVYRDIPWRAGRVTDFTLGEDRLDIRELLRESGYTGSDPIADRYLILRQVGGSAGYTEIYLDTDGAGAANTTNYLITALDRITPLVTWEQLSGGLDEDPGTPPSDAGQVLTSDHEGDTLVGGQGADTLNAGQGPDTLTGAGGGDAFVYAKLPWNAGHATDFTVGTDRLDLSRLFQASGYSGSDPVADGYVSFQSDGAGGTRIYFDTNGVASGGDWPWLITTLDQVSPNGLTWAQLSGGGVPPPPPPSGDGEELTWSQHGDTLAGGAGDDTINASRGPDKLSGGAGEDSFAWADLPWNAGRVTDFAPGADEMDLRALFQASGYAGADPLADRVLEFRSDGAGNTQVYFDADAPGSGEWPWLITTLDGVAPGQLGAGDWLFR